MKFPLVLAMLLSAATLSAEGIVVPVEVQIANGIETARVRQDRVPRTLEAPATTLFSPDRIAIASTHEAGRVIPSPDYTIPKVGQRVKKGTLLVVLDHALLQSEVLGLTNQRARLETDLKGARTDFENANREAVRVLASMPPTSPEAERANNALGIAKEKYDTIREQLDAFEAVTATMGSKDSIHARRSFQRSPIDGVVVSTAASYGKVMPPESELVRVIDTSEILAEVKLPADDFFSAASIESARVVLDLMPAAALPAEIVAVSPQVDTATGRFTVTLKMANEDGNIAAGMSGMARITVGYPVEVTLVPHEAVMQGDAGDFVLVKESGESFRRVAVRKSFESGPNVAIAAVAPDKLAANDRVVVQGAWTILRGEAGR